MAQPYKGSRKQYATRLPLSVAGRLEADAKRRGSTYNDVLAAIIAQHYGVPQDSPMPAAKIQQPTIYEQGVISA